MRIKFNWILLILLCGVFTLAAASQIEENLTLVYEKHGAAGLEYVLLSDQRQVYIPPASACFDISPRGIHVAYLSTDGLNLTVSRIDTSTVILQTTWQADWIPCDFGWINDTTIAIRSSSSQPDMYFEIKEGELKPVSRVPSKPPVLPDRSATDDIGVYIPAPTGNFYLYEMCSGPACMGMGDFAIYDTAAQANIVILSDAVISTPHYAPAGSIYSGPEAKWSFDGRYLAYRYVPENIYHNFDLQLYDTTSLSIHPIDAPNWRIDYEQSLSWSPTQYKLVFWIQGRVSEPLAGDTPDLSQAIIYNPEQNSLVAIDQAYHREQSGIIWKPDGAAFAFVTTEGNLVQVDVLTGVTQVVDTNVTRIMTWRSGES